MSLKIPIKPLVLVGPSGSGRSAIILHLTMNLPHKIHRVISHTTRKPRTNEKDALSFFFTSQTKIKQMEEKNQLFTLTKSPNNHYYGLSKQQVQEVIEKGRIPIFKMTLDAYLKNVNKMNKNQQSGYQSLYINVPNIEELERRLKYSPFSKEQIERKISTAKTEQEEASKYFSQENIIKNESMDETIIYVKSRLFEIY